MRQEKPYPLGMMTSATVDGRAFRYLYDANEERIAAVDRVPVSAQLRSRTTFTIRGFGNQLLSTWTDDWTSGSRLFTRKEDTIWRGSQLLARADGSNAMNYALDHLGSPRLITNGSGTVLDQQNFEPFGGGGLFGSGALQFTGHERDQANLGAGVFNLPDYMHARFYDRSGRFLSVDPGRADLKKPQSWNRYSYTMNNPINNTDPDGRETNPVTEQSYICDRQILNSKGNPDKGHWGNTRTKKDGSPKWHGGNDLAAPKGTPVFSPVSGTVVQSAFDAQFGGGYVLRIRRATTEDGKTVYVHMSHLNAQANVKVGDQVVEGQPNVAQVGNTGNAEREPPHVHTSVMVGGEMKGHQVDPQQWFREHPSNIPEKAKVPCVDLKTNC